MAAPTAARTERLLSAPIVPTIARLALPGVVLVAFQTAVSVGDTIFVGRLGTSSLAGLALVFPLVMLLQMSFRRRDGRRRRVVDRARARRWQAGARPPARGARNRDRGRLRPRVHRADARRRPDDLPAPRRPGRDAWRGARLLERAVRGRGDGLVREHVREHSARQRQHARAGDRALARRDPARAAERCARARRGPVPASRDHRRGARLRRQLRARRRGHARALPATLRQPAPARAPICASSGRSSPRSCASARCRWSRRCRPCSPP